MKEKIKDGCVVGYRFQATTTDGQPIESSNGSVTHYLQGTGRVLVGLENALYGRAAGDVFDVQLPPEEAFGLRDEENLVEADRGGFPKGADLRPGTPIDAVTADGTTIPMWVVDANEERVLLDENHPLAGETIAMHVEVVSVRAATAQERADGFAHVEPAAKKPAAKKPAAKKPAAKKPAAKKPAAKKPAAKKPAAKKPAAKKPAAKKPAAKKPAAKKPAAKKPAAKKPAAKKAPRKSKR